MAQIVGAMVMGMLFLMISGALRARFLDGLASVAEAVDRCGPTAYVGLGIVVAGGLLIVLSTGPEAQRNRMYRARMNRREKDVQPEKAAAAKVESE